MAVSYRDALTGETAVLAHGKRSRKVVHVGHQILPRSDISFEGLQALCLRGDAQTRRSVLFAFVARSRLNVQRALLVASTAALGACSLLLDTSAQQCSSNGDCQTRGGPFSNAICWNHVCVTPSTVTSSSAGGGGSTGSGGGGGGGMGGDPDASIDPVWGCLGHVTMEMPPPRMLDVSLPFFDLIRMVPITGVGVLLCN